MNPHIFGRGSWIIFFQIIFYFIKNLIIKKKYIKIIKDLNNTTEKRLEYLNKIQEEFHDFILNNEENNVIEKIHEIYLEDLKKKLSSMISSLPCNDCKNHCLNNINQNKIFEQNCMFVILHFFIELRNLFYNKKIDRSLFDDEESILLNEKYLFEIVIKN